jgi:hypothetical protein
MAIAIASSSRASSWSNGRVTRSVTRLGSLLAMGVTGKLTLLDGKTGRPRLTLDIEKMASLTVREDRGRGPRFVKWKPMPDNAHQTGEGKAYTAETDEAEAWWRRTRRRW